MAHDLIFQPAFIADARTNDNNPLFLAAKKNDLLGWNPRARTLLCGGAGDPGKAPTDPASAAFATYFGNYHGTYEQPFCQVQAHALFDTFR